MRWGRARVSRGWGRSNRMLINPKALFPSKTLQTHYFARTEEEHKGNFLRRVLLQIASRAAAHQDIGEHSQTPGKLNCALSYPSVKGCSCKTGMSDQQDR